MLLLLFSAYTAGGAPGADDVYCIGGGCAFGEQIICTD